VGEAKDSEAKVDDISGRQEADRGSTEGKVGEGQARCIRESGQSGSHTTGTPTLDRITVRLPRIGTTYAVSRTLAQRSLWAAPINISSSRNPLQARENGMLEE
jgi:hypothetical protein